MISVHPFRLSFRNLIQVQERKECKLFCDCHNSKLGQRLFYFFWLVVAFKQIKSP